MTDIRKGFAVRIEVHTPTLNNSSPEDIRFCIAAALEESAKPLLQEEVDFTVHVERIYESADNSVELDEDGRDEDELSMEDVIGEAGRESHRE